LLGDKYIYRHTDSKSDCSGKAQKQLNSKLQTRPLVREGATKYQSRRKVHGERKIGHRSQMGA
jgi:hypothetical protein